MPDNFPPEVAKQVKGRMNNSPSRTSLLRPDLNAQNYSESMHERSSSKHQPTYMCPGDDYVEGNKTPGRSIWEQKEVE